MTKDLNIKTERELFNFLSYTMSADHTLVCGKIETDNVTIKEYKLFDEITKHLVFRFNIKDGLIWY